ncbi:hypothetical protein Efla_006746 [Eimeria flavescens]
MPAASAALSALSPAGEGGGAPTEREGPPSPGGDASGRPPPPLDVECEYLLSPQLHFPDFVSPFLLQETAEQLVRLQELLSDPEALRSDPGRLVFAMQLARTLDNSATLEALSLADHLRILLGWKQLLVGPSDGGPWEGGRGAAAAESPAGGWDAEETDTEEAAAFGGLRPSLAARVCETLATALDHVCGRFFCPSYMRPSCRSSFLQLEEQSRSSSSSSGGGPGRQADIPALLQQLREGLWEWLLLRLLQRYNRGLRAPVGTGTAKRRALLGALVRLADSCRFLWENEEQQQQQQQQESAGAAAAAEGGPLTVVPWLGEAETVDLSSLRQALASLMAGLDARQSSLTLRARLLLLFACGSRAHGFVTDGSLLRWWRRVDGGSLTGWDPVFLCLLRRACKHGWARGAPLCCLLRPMLPFLLQIGLRSFAINGKNTAAAQQLRATGGSIPGELTPLLHKRIETPQVLAKVLVLLLEPRSSSSSSNSSSSEASSGSTFTPQSPEVVAAAKAAVEGAAAIDFAGSDSPAPPAAAAAAAAEGSAGDPATAFELLEVLVKTVGPWTHPQTETHRGLQHIAGFVAAFISAYLRRVSRERLGDSVANQGCGRHLQRCCALQQQQQQSQQQIRCCCDAGQGGARSNRLTRKDDEKIIELFLPVILDGLFSKHPQTASCFEEALRALLHLAPELSLQPLIDKILKTLETVTDASQTQAIEMLTRAAHAIVKFAPSMLPTLLDTTLQGIDPADPLKTFVTLSFHSIVFSYIPLIDCSSVSSALSDEELATLLANPDAAPPASFLECTDTADSARLSACSLVIPAAALAARGPRAVPCVSLSPEEGDCSSSGGGTAVGQQKHKKQHRPGASAASALPWGLRLQGDISFSRELIQQRGTVSSLLPEWALEWLRRILSLVEVASKPDEKSSGLMGRVDRGTYLALRAAGQAVFCHLSEETAAELRDLFVSWAATPHPDAVRLAASLTLSLSAAAPHLLLLPLLQLTESKLLEDTSHQQQQQQQQQQVDVCGVTFPLRRLKASVSVGSADWFLRLLSSALRGTGPVAVPFQQRLLSLLHAVLQHPKREIYRLGAKIMRRCIETWVGVYPWRLSHSRCMGSSEWGDTKRRQLFLLRWGAPFWIRRGGEEMDWHVPTHEELAAAQRFAVYGLAAARFLLLPLLPQGDAASPAAESPFSSAAAAAAAAALQGEEVAAAAAAFSVAGVSSGVASWSPHLGALDELRALPADFLGPLTEQEDRPAAAAAGAAAAAKETQESLDVKRRVRLTRALKLCRLLSKAAASQQPDDRPRRVPMWSVVTPYELSSAAAAPNSSSSSSAVSPFNSAALVEGIASLLLLVAETQLPLPEGPLLPQHIAAAAATSAATGGTPWGAPPPAAARQETGGDTLEEAKVLLRFLKVSRQLLVRPFTSWVYDAGKISKDGNNASQSGFGGEAVEIISSCYGMHESGFLHDVPRCVWAQGITNAWGSRLAGRRAHVGIQGWKQLLLLAVLNLASYHYAESRRFAQQILREAFAFYMGIRSPTLRLTLQLVDANSEQLPADGKQQQQQQQQSLTVPGSRRQQAASSGNGDAETAGDAADSRAAGVAPSSAETSPRFTSVSASPPAGILASSKPSSSSSTEEALQHARLTGVAYVLNSLSMLRRLWADPAALAQAVRGLLSVLSLKLERSTIQQRWGALANAIITQREALDRRHPKFNEHIVEGLLRPTLERMLSPGGSGSSGGSSAPHWRFVLVAGSICVCLNSPPIISLLPLFSKWLLTAADASLHPPMITAVGCFGLLQTLHFLKKRQALIPRGLLLSLHSPQSLQRLLQSLVCVNHESIRGAQGGQEGGSSSSSRAAAASDSSFPLVATVVKLDRSWPDQRAVRFSRLLSLHNMLFTKTLFQFLYETRNLLQQQEQQQQMDVDGPAAAGDATPGATAAVSFSQLLQQGLAPVLQAFFKAPNSELEKHITAVEIASAAAAAARQWEEASARDTLWQILCPLMGEDFNQMDDERLAAWSDGLRFALCFAAPRLGPLSLQQRQQQQQQKAAAAAAGRLRLRPFINFFLDARGAATPTETFLSVPPGDLAASSSGELTRQLRLYYAAVSVSLMSIAPRCTTCSCGHSSSGGSSSNSCCCGCGCCFAVATLEAGEETLLRCFSHPYKQVREEVARLMTAVVVGCDEDELLQQEADGLISTGRVSSEAAAAEAAAAAAACSCNCNPTAAAQRLRVYLRQQAASVLEPLAEAETISAAEREAGKSRSPALCASLTLLNCVTALTARRDGKTLASLGAAAGRSFAVYRHLTAAAAAADRQQHRQDTEGVLLALVIAASKHPDCDISTHGMHAAHYCCLVQQQRQLLSDVLQQQLQQQQQQQQPEAQRKCLLQQQRDLVASLVSFMRHPSWRVRAFIPVLLELSVTQHRFLLSGDPSYEEALSGLVQGLADPEASVRGAAKSALTPLLLGSSPRDCRFYCCVFRALAGPVSLRRVPPGGPPSWCRPLGGVTGLAALVATAPYDVPCWLPETVTALAEYANSSQGDSVRREVERALQEFFKTHQEGLEERHRAAFTEEQLDVLDTYKGRPTYFA